MSNMMKNEKVSVSLHKLEQKYRGVDGIAQTLNSDIKVSYYWLINIYSCREEFKALILTWKPEPKGKKLI